MPIVAVISQPLWDFTPEPKTTLPVLRVFGFERIINPNSDLDDIETFVHGVSCLLDTDLETLAKTHPDAWVSNNPIIGDWYPANPHRFHDRQLQILQAKECDINRQVSYKLFETDEMCSQVKLTLALDMEKVPKTWREKKANRTLV